MRNMGGLKKDLPITYWTFLIGALAIAGVPPLAGFFSKDEILFADLRERPHAAVGRRPADVAADRDLHVPPRVPGVPRRARVARAAPRASRARSRRTARTARAGARRHGHGHAGITCTTRRRRWRFALIVLAIGSVVAGYVGVPHALGGSNRIERVPRAELHAPTRLPASEPRSAADAGAAARRRAAGRRAPRRAGTELMLMVRLERRRARRHRHRAVLLAAEPRAPPTRMARSVRGRPHAAAEQVLRRRALRRRRSCSRSSSSRPEGCGRASTPA